MKTTAYLLLAAISLTACRSYEGTTLATGQVVDRHTGQPVPHATVQVNGLSSNTAVGGGSTGSSFPTDAQGRFSLSFEARRERNYTLFASTPSGYASDYGDCPLLSAGRKNDNLLVKAAAPAWVKISCVDDPPASRIGLTTSGYNGSADNQTIGPGNFFFVRPINSNSPGAIYWRILDEQGSVTEHSQPVTVTSFDTVTVTIHF